MNNTLTFISDLFTKRYADLTILDHISAAGVILVILLIVWGVSELLDRLTGFSKK